MLKDRVIIGIAIVILGFLFINDTEATVSGLITFLEGGTEVTEQDTVNFVAGSGISLDVTDNEANDRVDVTITNSLTPTPAGTEGHAILDDGVALTQRDNLNFTGDGVTCTDDNSTTTKCEIPGLASVTLGTDTTGDYVEGITEGTAIDISGSGGEGSTPTVAFDSTELGNTTFGSDAGFTHTYNPGGTNNPSYAYTDGKVTLQDSDLSIRDGDIILQDQGSTQYFEANAGGTNSITIQAPASITTDQACTMEDDSTPLDSCITTPTPDFPMRLADIAAMAQIWEIPGWSGSISSDNYTDGAFTLTPIFVAEESSFSAMAMQVFAADSAGDCRMGIYEDDGGKPGSLLLDAGTVSTATTGVKQIAITQTLERGYYWSAIVCEASGTLEIGECSTTSAVDAPVDALAQSTTGDFFIVGPRITGQEALVDSGLPDPFPNASADDVSALRRGCHIRYKRS